MYIYYNQYTRTKKGNKGSNTQLHLQLSYALYICFALPPERQQQQQLLTIATITTATGTTTTIVAAVIRANSRGRN